MSEQVRDVWLVVDDKNTVAWTGLGVSGNGHPPLWQLSGR